MTVTTEVHDGTSVRVITISDPAKLNAFGDELRNGLAEHLADATADEDCRAIVITGADGAFSAGGELSSMPIEPDAIRRRMGRMQDIVRSMVNAPQVVIAAVEGVAYGSALSVASAADIVIAGEGARFGCTFGRVGLMPDVGFLWTVPRRVGIRRARLMALDNAILEADVALDWGLVDATCAAGGALEEAVARAGRIARTPAATLGHVKAMLATDFTSFDELLEEEIRRQIELLGTEEFAAARAAFLARSKQ